MAFDGVNFFSAVIIASEEPARLYDFYKNKLKFPLEAEQHGDTDPHYGCEMGDLHFAIHPISNFDNESPGVGSVKLAFEVFDIDSFVEHLKSVDVQPLYPPKAMGPMRITAIKDPDGNHIEFTELKEGWIRHIEDRRDKGFDLIKQFKERQGK